MAEIGITKHLAEIAFYLLDPFFTVFESSLLIQYDAIPTLHQLAVAHDQRLVSTLSGLPQLREYCPG